MEEFIKKSEAKIAECKQKLESDKLTTEVWLKENNKILALKLKIEDRIELETLQKKNNDTFKKQFAKLVNSIDSEVVGDQRSSIR